MLAISASLIFSGVVALNEGVAHDKCGSEITEKPGAAMPIIRIVAGTGFALFGIYKMVDSGYSTALIGSCRGNKAALT